MLNRTPPGSSCPCHTMTAPEVDTMAYSSRMQCVAGGQVAYLMPGAPPAFRTSI
jgi:hypothetical protein